VTGRRRAPANTQKTGAVALQPRPPVRSGAPPAARSRPKIEITDGLAIADHFQLHRFAHGQVLASSRRPSGCAPVISGATPAWRSPPSSAGRSIRATCDASSKPPPRPPAPSVSACIPCAIRSRSAGLSPACTSRRWPICSGHCSPLKPHRSFRLRDGLISRNAGDAARYRAAHSSISITGDVHGHTSDDTARSAVDGWSGVLAL
jgi:hypothetical protein